MGFLGVTFLVLNVTKALCQKSYVLTELPARMTVQEKNRYR